MKMMTMRKTTKISEQDSQVVKHAQSKITVEQLDELMEWVLQPKGLKFSWIIHVIKLLAIFAYLYCRNMIIQQTWDISLQKYERDRIKDNRKQVEDDLA